MKKSNTIQSVIFDLDGVITKTALVHSAAWKKMFDEFLHDWYQRKGEAFIAFDHEKDYLPFVDGKPRYKGVESFLLSRDIHLPFGTPEDSTDQETVCGLGNRKNEAFNDVLTSDGVEVYPSTIQLIHDLKARDIRVGVASSSKNCKLVLEKAGLIDLFETRVDGLVSAEMGLHGKPEADIFTTAADHLDASYDRSVVVEDAVSGVQAGRAGNFGLVLGIARENNHQELKINGADIVVSDIGDIGIEGILEWFDSGLEKDNWLLSYSDYKPEKEKSRETLLSIGNGYVGTRGSMEESQAGATNYPASYMAGLYNRLTSKVADRDVENEDFVNFVNWSLVQFQINGEGWIDLSQLHIVSIQRSINTKTGVYSRKVIFRDNKGRETQIQSERWASMSNPHLFGQKYQLSPLNYSGEIKLKSSIDGAIINDGVARYRQLNQHHLKQILSKADKKGQFVAIETNQSKIRCALAAKLNFELQLGPGEQMTQQDTGLSMDYHHPEGKAESIATAKLKAGQSLSFEKIVQIYSSQPWDSSHAETDAQSVFNATENYSALKQNSAERWKEIWDHIDIKIEGDRLAQKLIRLHLYHLMVSLSPNNKTIDASITARGLHGEAYRGHIFWDELFILPLYNLHFPDITKATLMYRYKRLDAARANAKAYGYAGAMFPWQSGSDGREETQVLHLNPLTGHWGDDFSSLQRHVSLAIAYNTWQYIHVTGDLDFLADYGAEMFLDICRFWASKAHLNKSTGRYSIHHIMGPDEFHEKYPDAEKGGLKDNAYTNLMVAWAMDKAFDLLEMLSEEQVMTIKEKINLTDKELTLWKDISRKINIIIDDDILAQYDGYFDLKELDWDYYKEKYGNIYRMDRLLKAEEKSADDYKVAKQADTLQTFFNLNENTVNGILKELGYHPSADYLSKNLKYYLQRTSHGSTLSRVVHAQLANMIDDADLSWNLYLDALTSDYSDVQGGTTGEGIHAGVMAGTILIALQTYGGIDLRGDLVNIEPHFPKHWRKLTFNFLFKKLRYFCTVSTDAIHIQQTNEQKETVEIIVKGKKVILKNDELLEIKY